MTTTTTAPKTTCIVKVYATTQPRTDRCGRTHIGVKVTDVETYETFWVNHYGTQPIQRTGYYKLESHGSYLVFTARVQRRAK